MVDGRTVSRAPTMSPTIATPPICCQSDSVWLSYMIRSLWRSRPLTPKS